MRIKGAASWGWNEAKLWVLRPMEELPDTGSIPAQMDIEVSYNSRVHREDYIECVSGVSRPTGAVLWLGSWMSVGRPRQDVIRLMKEGARYVGSVCKVNYRKVGRKCLQGKLSQGR